MTGSGAGEPGARGVGGADPADLVELSPRERRRLLRNPHDRPLPPSKLNQTLQMLLVIGFVVVMITGLAFLVADRWRRGTVTIGSGMLLLGLLRLVVDGKILGVLSVRSRRFDSGFCVAVGVAMLVVALSVDPLGS
ncbi:MAG: DUF3017 domain-containing protein [Mycobacteriaceae bacterium]|uniref:DUF3017 domain-containing protein n=1 Tax=Corynebacterium sp. TaxID=1720 RepID=UPI003F95C25F